MYRYKKDSFSVRFGYLMLEFVSILDPYFGVGKFFLDRLIETKLFGEPNHSENK